MDRAAEARWQRVIIAGNPAFARLMGVRFTSSSRKRIEAGRGGAVKCTSRASTLHPES